jgi:hypothetical protein
MAAVSRTDKKAAALRKEANRIRQRRFLEKNRDKVNKERREKYAARKDENRCPRCGKKLRSQKYVLCKVCLGKAKEYNSAAE